MAGMPSLKTPAVQPPLGMIALFVALIELFLAYPVTKLDGNERRIMVAFMVFFQTMVAIGLFKRGIEI